MDIHRYDNAQRFLEKVESCLMAHEAVNNLPLGILYRLIREGTNPDQPEPFLAVLEEKNQPVLIMVMTPPHNLIIYGIEPGRPEALEAAAAYLSTAQIEIPGVIGQRDTAERFMNIWTRKRDCTASIQMEQRIYKLEKVEAPGNGNGHLRLATMDDLSIASEWIHAFSVEALEPMNREEAHEHAKRVINRGTLYLWENEEVVSMAGCSRPTQNGYTVSLVYTPPEQRGKGYATNCVAALSQLILDEGYQFCSLYTDLANPTSNSIYMKIGYKPIEDSIVYQFNGR
ncbi:MAG TPA: GNAT family N-acetyltransferase [Bacillales bacterium]|nr:GNAT family N-acetyltransferase [Bacillales bacterium]